MGDLPVGVGELGDVHRVDRPTDPLDRDIVVSQTIAEQFDVRFGNRLACYGVSHIEPLLAVERFLGDHRVGEPDDDAARVAVGQFGDHEVSPGLREGRRHRDAAIKMLRARIQGQLPLRDLGPDILLLVVGNDAVADLVEVELLPIDLLRVSLEIRFDVGQEVIDFQLMSGELHFLGVAEAEVERRAATGGLDLAVVEAAPIVSNLVESLLAKSEPTVERKPGDCFAPNVRGAIVLSAVFVDRPKLIERLVGITVLAVGQRLVDLDRVMFVRQLETTHARG